MNFNDVAIISIKGSDYRYQFWYMSKDDAINIMNNSCPNDRRGVFYYSTALRCGSFSEKNIEKKHLCRHYKNYYYFCKSNIPVINLIAGSRNMIKVSKNVTL